MHDLTHYKHRDGSAFPIEECSGFQVLRTGKTLPSYEDSFIRKDGTFFDVVYSSSPLAQEETYQDLSLCFAMSPKREPRKRRCG